MEQHAAATAIMAEQLPAGLMKLRRCERLDEQLRQLIFSFYLISRDMYFKRD